MFICSGWLNSLHPPPPLLHTPPPHPGVLFCKKAKGILVRKLIVNFLIWYKCIILKGPVLCLSYHSSKKENNPKSFKQRHLWLYLAAYRCTQLTFLGWSLLYSFCQYVFKTCSHLLMTTNDYQLEVCKNCHCFKCAHKYEEF